jgi:glycosyltransferase involved in cell wall biosynthesis
MLTPPKESKTNQRSRPLRVIIVTPLGQGGRGGIDRMMDEIRSSMRSAPRTDISVSFWTTRGRGHILLSIFLVARLLLRLSLHPFGFGPDLLHVNLSSHGSTWRKLVICRFARLFGIPYLIHLHGSRFRQFWAQTGPFLSDRISDMFRNAAGVLVLGKCWRTYLRDRLPDIEANIAILPNATRKPLHPTSRKTNPVEILFLGEVGARKGVPQLIEALSALPRDGHWHATIAGNGEVQEMRANVSRRGLSGMIFMTGWVGPERVRELLAASNILVLPSFDENLPMSIIEGMANGLAIVATPVGAVEDIIKDGVTGLIVPPGDVAMLASALTRLFSDPELRETLGRAACAFQNENLEIQSYVDRLVVHWTELAAR